MIKIRKGEGIWADWKEALITPLFKKRDKEEVSNYREISLPSIINNSKTKRVGEKGKLYRFLVDLKTAFD